LACPVLAQKRFRLTRRANQWFESARLTRTRGGSRSSRTCGGMRWTQMAAKDERCRSRTAKSCGPDAPTLASSSREAKLLRGDGGKKAVHRGELGVSRKPSRRESRDVSATPVCSCAFSFCAFAHETAGASRRPVFPAPSACLRAKEKRKARARSRREGADAREACCLTVEYELRCAA